MVFVYKSYSGESLINKRKSNLIWIFFFEKDYTNLYKKAGKNEA